MKTTKYSIADFSFYDQRAIEQKLEQMAAKGWMVCKAGNLFWTYKKTEPQKLRFAVTYFPEASEFDPAPSEKQLDKEALCAHDGWRLVLRWDVMQIFCTDREDAVPIETDPVPHAANIYRTIKKKFLTGQLVTLIAILWFIFLQISQFVHDPVDFLSSTNHVFTIPFWLLLLLWEISQIWLCFGWAKKAKKAAEDGIFLPMHTNKWLSWSMTALTVLFLLLSYSNGETHLLFMLCFAAVMLATFFMGRFMLGWLKKKGFPRQLNLAVSFVCTILLSFIGVAVIVEAGINGVLPINRGSKPTGTYEYNGHVFDLYNDTLPLEVEDLTDVTADWSKRAIFQESILLSYGEYRQDMILTEKVGNYDLNYEITDIKLPILYDFIKNSLVHAKQDEVHDDFVFTDHYEAIDPTPWNAMEAYQLHWSGSILDTYLVCWENRIAEIQFFWQPTLEQIQTAADILKP